LVFCIKKNLATLQSPAGKPFSRQTRGRCYDFLNIFAENLGEKIGVFDAKRVAKASLINWLLLH
jgi:hypothetical protein